MKKEKIKEYSRRADSRLLSLTEDMDIAFLTQIKNLSQRKEITAMGHFHQKYICQKYYTKTEHQINSCLVFVTISSLRKQQKQKVKLLLNSNQKERVAAIVDENQLSCRDLFYYNKETEIWINLRICRRLRPILNIYLNTYICRFIFIDCLCPSTLNLLSSQQYNKKKQ